MVFLFNFLSWDNQVYLHFSRFFFLTISDSHSEWCVWNMRDALSKVQFYLIVKCVIVKFEIGSNSHSTNLHQSSFCRCCCCCRCYWNLMIVRCFALNVTWHDDEFSSRILLKRKDLCMISGETLNESIRMNDTKTKRRREKNKLDCTYLNVC